MMPNLRDERDGRVELLVRNLKAELALMHDDLARARAQAAAEQVARERAQQALRKINERIPDHNHYRGCMCSECAWLAELKAIARRGLEGE